MSYKVFYRASAEDDLNSIHEPARSNIRAAIRSLASDPRPPGLKKMVSMGDTYRIRVGSYRIAYQIADGKVKIVTIIAIDDRKAIYPVLKRRLKK